jgi:ABC-type amino acid transport substrate-binding protein
MDYSIRLVLAGILVFALSGCAKSGPVRTESEYPVYSSCRDIPGVTPEELEAVEKLKAGRDHFIYGAIYSTETFQNDDGSFGGFSAKFCKWLSSLFGIPFSLEIFEWEDLAAGLQSGEIDFTGELTAAGERYAAYFMTTAIAERSIKIMRVYGAEPLAALVKTRPPIYIFLEGATAYDLAAPYLENGFKALFVGNYEAAYQMLKEGRADAFLGDGTAEAAFDRYGDVTAEDFFPLMYGQVSLAARKAEFEPVISIVQKALENGMVYHLTDMYNQGHWEYLRYKLYSRLTGEEKLYIRMHRTKETAVRLAAEYDNYPASFYNTHEQEWQGTAFDVLREIEKFTGLAFTIVNDNHTEWLDLLRMLDEGRAAMVTELIRSRDRQGRYLWADEPYQQDYFALLSAADYKDIKINEILYSRVGLISDSVYAETFRLWFPNDTNTVEYPSNISALEALARGG